MISTVLSLLGGWKKWAAVGLVGIGLIAWVGVLKLQVASLRTDKATLSGIVDVQAERLQRATADIIQAGRINRDNVAAFEAERAQCRAGYAALQRQLDAARQTTITKEKVHAAALECSGVPPAGRVLARRVREQDASAAASRADGDHPGEGPAP
jgi:hypothetical protein